MTYDFRGRPIPDAARLHDSTGWTYNPTLQLWLGPDQVIPFNTTLTADIAGSVGLVLGRCVIPTGEYIILTGALFETTINAANGPLDFYTFLLSMGGLDTICTFTTALDTAAVRKKRVFAASDLTITTVDGTKDFMEFAVSAIDGTPGTIASYGVRLTGQRAIAAV